MADQRLIVWESFEKYWESILTRHASGLSRLPVQIFALISASFFFFSHIEKTSWLNTHAKKWFHKEEGIVLVSQLLKCDFLSHTVSHENCLFMERSQNSTTYETLALKINFNVWLIYYNIYIYIYIIVTLVPCDFGHRRESLLVRIVLLAIFTHQMPAAIRHLVALESTQVL